MIDIAAWRGRIIAADWRTPDIDRVSLELSALARQAQTDTVELPCVGLDPAGIGCEREKVALDALSEQGLVELIPGELTQGCCWARHNQVRLLLS